MDCNRDEAVRAKEIAERKVTERDYAGARKFALKALSLYPGLEGISQMLTIIDVYVSAEKKINGEVDWYAILGTNPWVDDETVRKQYRKLALALHPDKNKVTGADGAFKLVSEAWSLLSDKAKRLAYNEKLNSRVKLKSQSKIKVPFSSPNANGIHTSSSKASSNARTQNNATQGGPTLATTNQNPGTFWTICNRCKTQYEYLRMYLNHTLLCPNCREAFLALERPPPTNAFKSSNLSSRQQHQNSRHHNGSSNTYNTGAFMGFSSSNDTNLQWGPFSRMADVNSKVELTSTAMQQVHEKLKRESNEAWAATSKKIRVNDNHMNGYVGDMSNQMAMGNGFGLGSFFECKRGSSEAERTYGFSGTNNKYNRERELSLFEVRNMLVDKARSEICEKLKDWSSVNAKTANKEEKMKEKENKKQISGANHEMHDTIKHNGFYKNYKNKEPLSGFSDDDLNKHAPALSINVPDSDFHNFDLDRTENSFEDDQVWAAYDDDDGMPRYYARIHKVISLKPFKMRISWLNSRSNSELGPMNWIDSGFIKTCGDFRTGRHEISETLNSFSHNVRWTKGTRGIIRIFPSKGDVWALYRNWSPDWNEQTSNDVIHKYDMVEVLDHYNEEQGVLVQPLVKAASFKSVFHKNMDPKSVWRIPKEEMFRFSHQVPGHLLTGQEAHNAPMGSWELDPAAIPLELLQVITEGNDAPLVENVRKVEVDELGDNCAKAGEGEIAEHDKESQLKIQDMMACRFSDSRGTADMVDYAEKS
ncbi:uncharacterized protein LOC123197966 isoform X2 [Mangifera indica]|uniref:uncharacterized protein LOC123197966 isoform X2 n=1 Tax=Mangifera indica TaxID=29780 RepID=UPI001CFBFEA1|nr:uncharacterized protein LOC123197966 isoform X2 [Mangifera indica]